MGLREDIRAFVVAISDGVKESKNNKKTIDKIFDKYKGQDGRCMFCGQEFPKDQQYAEIKDEELVEPNTI